MHRVCAAGLSCVLGGLPLNPKVFLGWREGGGGGCLVPDLRLPTGTLVSFKQRAKEMCLGFRSFGVGILRCFVGGSGFRVLGV